MMYSDRLDSVTRATNPLPLNPLLRAFFFFFLACSRHRATGFKTNCIKRFFEPSISRLRGIGQPYNNGSLFAAKGCAFRGNAAESFLRSNLRWLFRACVRWVLGAYVRGFGRGRVTWKFTVFTERKTVVYTMTVVHL